MPRLLSSVFSDPIASGINAFKSVSDVLNQQESLKMRRELLEREKAESVVKTEREKLQMEQTRKAMEQQDYTFNLLKERNLRGKDLDKYKALDDKLNQGLPLNSDDIDTLFRVGTAGHVYEGLDVNQIHELHKNVDKLEDGLKRYWPQINEKLERKEGVYVKEEQAPEWFNALNNLYKNQINTGAHRFKGNAEKRITQLYFDPRDGQMTPMLRVQSSEGEVYYAPMTLDRGTDENAPVLQMPYQMFGAHLSAHISMSKRLRNEMIKLGDKETQKRVEKANEDRRKNQLGSAGDEAVYELLKKEPNAPKNKIENVFKKAWAAKSEETGITYDRKELLDEVARISDKVAGVPKIQNIQIGDKNVPHVWNAEKGTFEPVGEGGPKFKPDKPKEESDKTPTSIKEFEEVEKMTPEKKKGFYKHRELMKEKPPTEEKPLSVTEQREMRTEALGRFTKFLSDDVEGRDDIIKRKNLDEVILNLPDEQQSQAKDMVDRATELKKGNRKLTWNQAFNQAEKELGKIEKKLKPLTPEKIQEIVDVINKRTDPTKKTREEAERLARQDEYDPANAFEGYGYGGGVLGIGKSFGPARGPQKGPSRELLPRSEFEKPITLGKRPDVDAVTKEMSGKPKGKYRVEGHMGVWDGKTFRWIEEKMWTEEELRNDLKAHGMGKKEINEYIERAKEAGKL